MTFSFRFRCSLNESTYIAVKESRLILVDEDGVLVYICNEGDGPGLLDEADVLTFRGSGYSDRIAAAEACAHWVRATKMGFAGSAIGADFSVREPHPEYPEEHREVTNEAGERHIADDGAPIVYTTKPSPIFSRAMSGTIRRGVHKERLLSEIAHVQTRLLRGRPLSVGLRVAYDLYSAAQSLDSPDAQLVMYVSAVEAVSERESRSPEAQGVVEALRESVKKSALDVGERNSLLSAIKDLRKVSIATAGRLAARRIRWPISEDESAEQLFKRAYKVRSLIVHGNSDRPDVGEVTMLAVKLNLMVGRLLSTIAVEEEWPGEVTASLE